MEIDKIKEIMRLMKENDLKVFSLEEGETELYLEAHSENEAPAVNQPQTEIRQPEDILSNTKIESKLIEVRADQVGIFYTQPEEDSTETFVAVGDKVEVGDQIGLIEVMKLFNEVRVEQAGIVEEILVANGEPVEYDQVVMLLRPEEA